MDWCLFDLNNLSIFYLFLLVSYVKRIKTLSWGGGPKMWRIPVLLDRDPHPTCTRCRGRICTRDMTCDFCVGWSPSQWEAFAKKHAYKDRKRSSCPSGSLPPAAATSPRAGTSSEGLHPEASSSSSSSSSLPSGGQAKREGSRDAPCAASREASSPPTRPRSSERGGSVSGRSSGGRERASGRGKLLVRSGRPLPAPLPRLPLPAHHGTLCDVVSRESLRRSTPVLDPPVFPDLRIEEQGRIAGPALGRPPLVTGPVILALALLTARGQVVESVGGGPRLDRCPPASGRNVIGRSLQAASGRVAFALRETGRDPRIDTGLAETAFDVTGRGLLTAFAIPCSPGRSL